MKSVERFTEVTVELDGGGRIGMRVDRHMASIIVDHSAGNAASFTSTELRGFAAELRLAADAMDSMGRLDDE